jgi:hypothetical protein
VEEEVKKRADWEKFITEAKVRIGFSAIYEEEVTERDTHLSWVHTATYT